MTYAIRRNNGDVLYFDAITDITEKYAAQITKHPLASGSLISDHTIVDNKKFSLKAVLSDADFNYNRPSQDYNTTVNSIGLQQGTVSFPTGGQKQFVNDTETRVPVVITNGGAKWRSFLPEVVAQFTASTIPTVTVLPQEKVKTARAVKQTLIDMLHAKESFTLVEYNSNFIANQWPNVVMVGLTFTENAETGDGLFPNMEMEEATYTSVKNVKIKMTVTNKGRQVGEKTKAPEEKGDDAQNEPTANAKKTSGSHARNAANIFKRGS